MYGHDKALIVYNVRNALRRQSSSGITVVLTRVLKVNLLKIMLVWPSLFVVLLLIYLSRLTI